MSIIKPNRCRSGSMWRRLARARRGDTALEFALLSLPFLIFTLGTFEVSFDLFTQEATDLALQAGARKMETGIATNSSSESNFVATYMCNTTAGRLLICNNLHVKVQLLTGSEDFSSAGLSTGKLPMNGNTLNLSSFDGSNGVAVFCNAPPGSLMLISAVYVGPTFLGGLLPGFGVLYNGRLVHAVLSQIGVASEMFPLTSTSGAAPQC